MPFSMDEIPHGEHRILSLLIPYWGMKVDGSSKRLEGALFDRSVWINGLSESNVQKLSQLLKHTGIQLNLNKEANVKILIEKNSHNNAPITLKSDTAAYHLKPLRKKTNDVQTWIHKRLWLPVKEHAFTILFHPREENNIPEWLFYLIVQYYMQPFFENLAEIDFTEYQRMAGFLLSEINEDLKQCQLSLSQTPSQSWPQLPPENLSMKQDSQHPEENPIHPFQSKRSKSAKKKLKPFGRKHAISKSHPINPFKNKNNHRSL